jgi:hypothetical protein
MSSSRSEFIQRIDLMEASLSEPSVNDGAPNDVRKNGIASVLRNGIAVLSFATIEAFIRERTAEILNSFDSSAVSFSDLPDRLKQAVTLGALRAVNFRCKFEPPATRVHWALGEVATIASASKSLKSLSTFSFGHESSNLDAEDVSDILKSFGVMEGWNCITSLSKRIGLGGAPDYKAAFSNVASARHSAAHDVTTNTAIGNLVSSLTTIRSVGVCFDILLSEALCRINKSLTFPAKGTGTLDQLVKLRFLSDHQTLPGKVSEKIELTISPQKLSTVQSYDTWTAARAAAITTCNTQKEHLIQLNKKSIPESWTHWT